MPALLMQSVYVDLHNVGIVAAQNQIIQIVTGDDTYAPQHANFSNLSASVTKISLHHYEIEVSASHLSEHTPTIVIITNNSSEEISPWIKGASAVHHKSGYEFKSVQGSILQGFSVSPAGGDVIKPKFPRVYELRSSGKPIELAAVAQELEPNRFRPLPTKDL